MKVFCNKIFLVAIFLCFNANALSPETRLNNPEQEGRAMELFLKVRCLTCQGQVIENSDSEFSYEMRQLIRKKISQGKTDEQIKIELIDKFGTDILVDVQIDKKNSPLWILPLLFSIIAAILFFRKKKESLPPHLLYKSNAKNK